MPEPALVDRKIVAVTITQLVIVTVSIVRVIEAAVGITRIATKVVER